MKEPEQQILRTSIVPSRRPVLMSPCGKGARNFKKSKHDDLNQMFYETKEVFALSSIIITRPNNDRLSED